MLDRLAHATREQLRVQEELRAYQARDVLSARIVAAVPLVVLVVIRQINPAYLANEPNAPVKSLGWQLFPVSRQTASGGRASGVIEQP